MPKLPERLQACAENEAVDPALMSEAAAEIRELRKRQDELEELLIMIVRTGWPWDGDGAPNEIFRTCRDGYVNAMIEAQKLLGLDHLSRITRTEPRT